MGKKKGKGKGIASAGMVKDAAKPEALAPWDEGYVAIVPAYTDGQAELMARLRADVDGRLWGKRLTHVVNVAQTSVWLAQKAGVDLFEAEAAGLLHDWDKKLSSEELWAKVETYRIEVPRRDEILPVLHGLTAAASLPADYPELPASVFQAIARHTTGAVGMTDLDKVVYVADMLEPGRTGGNIERLRELSRTCGIRALYAECVRLGLVHLLESGRFVYPDALNVWNDCRLDAPVSDIKE